jgi:hypothetical protein
MQIDIRKFAFCWLSLCALAFPKGALAQPTHLVLGISGSRPGLDQKPESLKTCITVLTTTAGVGFVQPDDCTFPVYDANGVNTIMQGNRKALEDQIATTKMDILTSFNKLPQTVIDQIKTSVVQQVEQDLGDQLRKQAVTPNGRTAANSQPRRAGVLALYGFGLFTLGLAVGGTVIWKYRA